MENWNKIQEIYTESQNDAEKFFDKGNSSAGTRLRKAYQKIAILCKEGRKEVSNIKNADKK